MNRIVYALLFIGSSITAPVWAFVGLATYGEISGLCAWLLCVHAIVSGLSLAAAVLGKAAPVFVCTVDVGAWMPKPAPADIAASLVRAAQRSAGVQYEEH